MSEKLNVLISNVTVTEQERQAFESSGIGLILEPDVKASDPSLNVAMKAQEVINSMASKGLESVTLNLFGTEDSIQDLADIFDDSYLPYTPYTRVRRPIETFLKWSGLILSAAVVAWVVLQVI